jgi:hypothetical protein
MPKDWLLVQVVKAKGTDGDTSQDGEIDIVEYTANRTNGRMARTEVEGTIGRSLECHGKMWHHLHKGVNGLATL